ncbi:hypothetical protein [Arthrobacter sp. P2b]|uniref:hypothetical protein n=1 Tax=Arthrobacter sp. P2b TaxID=1938741 RepID=UPI0009A6F2AA|nr:hypothetical protein [Arthrobacter sp. P2b]SLK01273.1 hypothetical protein SAMN06272721_103278 [Arthrobacter sp. P2b]
MRDESYEAGYRAGHLQGWLDAMAKVAQDQPQRAAVPQAAAVPQTVPPTMPGSVSPRVVQGQPLPKPRPLIQQPAPQKPARPSETPAERQARRERRDRQNINVTLYVASLLLVAAAALFVGTGLPPTLRFAGVFAVASLFYASGFVLQSKVPRLKPAAVAFTGTGLALVPVIGLALYNFAWHNGPAAWLTTSVIGTVAYIVAARRLESRVLAYLSLTFVISTAWSGIAVLGAALVWYFVALIGVAVILTVLSLVKPGWLPPLFARPLATLHPVVVPTVAVVVTFFPLLLTRVEYALVMALCGAYFGVVAAVPAAQYRVRHFYAARATLTVAGAIAAWELTGHGADALFTAAGLLALQSIAVAYSGERLDAWFPRVPGQAFRLGRRTKTSDGGALLKRCPWHFDALATFWAQFVVTAAFAGSVVLEAALAAETGSDGPLPLWLPLYLLLLTSFVVGARLGAGAQFLPFTALVLAGVVLPTLGEWAFAVMLVLASVIWLVRGLRTGSGLRRLMMFNARVAVTLAVPSVVAAFTEGRAQDQAVWFSLVAAAAGQQVLSAALQRAGRSVLAPQATLIGCSGLGVAAVAVLASVEGGPVSWLTWGSILLQVAAACAVGLLLVPRPAEDGGWRASVGEGVPPVTVAVMVGFAFQWVSLGAGNTALLLFLAYLTGTGLRLPARLHRWSYWWMGRATGTLLAITAFEQLTRTAGAPVLGGEDVQPAAVLGLVLGLQVALVLAAYLLHRAPRGAVIDAGCVILLQVAACAFLAPLGEGSWQNLMVPAVAAVFAAGAGYVLRREAGAPWFAPASFVVLMFLSAGNLTLVELLLAIFALFAAVMVAAAPQPVRKGWYFVAARVLTAALAVVFSYDVTASPAAVSVTFAGVLVAQHAVRWVMRFRLQTVPFQQAAVWITLGSQAVLPLIYALQYSRNGNDDGGRWVVLLELALLLASAAVARRLFAARGALYFGVWALLFAVFTLSPFVSFGEVALFTYTGTAIALLLPGLSAAAIGALWRRRNIELPGIERWLWLVAALSFTLAALVVAPRAADWVAGAAVLALAAVLFTASHVERTPALYPPAALGVLVSALMLAAVVAGAYEGEWGRYLPWLTGPGVAAVGLYAVRRVRAGGLVQDPVRRWALAGATLLGLGATAAAGLQSDATAWVGAAALACTAAVALLEAPPTLRRMVAELGVLAVVAAVQRAAIFELDTWDLPHPFWVAQWYVVLGAILAALRYRSGHEAVGRTIAGASGILLTLSGAGVVFGGTGGQQLWLLVLLAVMLVAGLALGDRLFVRWGAGGVAACILWAMREYTFALLALIAVGLIAFAVWRLNRSTETAAAGSKDRPARNLP